MRARRFLKLTAAIQATLLLASLFLPALAAATSIQTDLWVYQNGDTVTVTGTDFGASEIVDVVTTDAASTIVDSGPATTDELGNFTYVFVLNATVDGLYDVVATGETSGLSAATQFDPGALTVGAAVASAFRTVAQGSGVSGFDVTVSGTYDCSSPCTAASGNAITVSIPGIAAATRAVAATSSGTNNGWSTVYAFRTSPSGAQIAVPADGAYTVNASFAFSGTGSPKSASTTNYFKVDNTAPTVSMTSGALSVTNTSPIPVTVTFSESVTGFVAGDVVPANGTVGGFSGSGTNYSFNLTPSGQGLVTADIGAGVANDVATLSANSPNVVVAGNPNSAATQFSRTFDSVALAPVITGIVPAGPANNNSPHVQGTGENGATVTIYKNGMCSNPAGPTGIVSGTTFDIAVPVADDSSTTFSAKQTDSVGNTSGCSTGVGPYVEDSTGPSVTITQAVGQTDPTGTSPVNFNVHFSESVGDFAIGDVTIGGTAGATTASVTGSGLDYNVAVSGMTTDGTVVITVAAGVAHDNAGNASLASTNTDNSVIYDTSAPTGTVSINNGAASTTSTSVTLRLQASDPGGVAAYRIANGFDCSSATYVAVGPATSIDLNPGPALTLPNGGGPKTVCAQYKDALGHESSTVLDSITFQAPSSLTETISPTPIFYGMGTTIFGDLTDGSSGFGIVSVLVTDNLTNNPCSTVGAFVGSDTTDGSGHYVVAYTPTSPGTEHIKASFAGNTDHLAATNCADLVINKAPSAVANSALSSGSITTAGSSLLSYKVQSAYGVATHLANGTVSAVTDSALLICNATSTGVTASQADADGTGAADAGFGFSVNGGSNTTYQFVCSSTTPGTYHVHIHYSGDNEYEGSDGTTLALVVTAGDAIKPLITAHAAANGSPYTAGDWTKYNVVVTFTCADEVGGSGIFSNSIAGDTRTSEGAGQSVTNSGSCVDNAGNVADPVTFSPINIDKTAPVISGSPDRAANSFGWYNADVTVSFTCSDALSGTDTNTVALDNQTLGEGAGQSVSSDGDCTDKAGNTASTPVTVSGINIDKTAPTMGGSASPAANANGWNNTNVTVTFTCIDGLSGVDSFSPTSTVLSAEAAGQSASSNCTDKAGNAASKIVSGINIDKTAPVISGSRSPAPNINGWNNTNVTVHYTCSDSLSGVDTLTADQVISTEGAGQSRSGTCVDKAGNSAGTNVTGINIDKTAPTSIAFVGGGLVEGMVYYFGFVPAGPTSCTADYTISGSAGCIVSGYSTAIGAQTVTAAASDLAGNTGYKYLHYSVNAWTLKGFYAPVDMNNIVNTVKGGSTVPLKFNVFAGLTELTSVSYIKGFKATQVACGAFIDMAADAIEITSTGGTTLRYDGTGAQFIQNWQTPKSPNTCWVVAMTTLDGSSIFANFQLK
jgi:hypothetical protein